MERSELFIWPEWFEKHRISEKMAAKAYNDSPDQFKAVIKTAIALSFFHFKKKPSSEFHSFKNKIEGFATSRSSFPVPWALLIYGENCGAAHITSSAVLPILANVPQIAGCCLGKPGNAFLLSMELCGIEDIFQLSYENCERALRDIISFLGSSGRIIIITNSEENCFNLYHTDYIYYIPIGTYKALALPSSSIDLETIEFCLGHAPITDKNIKDADIIYTGQISAKLPNHITKNAKLILNKGCEGLWIFTQLKPNIFKNYCFDFSIEEES